MEFYLSLSVLVNAQLDQDITRTSFRHFHTQPHYDDPRVEWWYGDATKTLPLLPKEYWGSFDLVLVDLSETVVSMDVTGNHDILDVLENLLKPEGVILENELYIASFMEHFDHTIQIFYGSPKVCTQVLTLASNKVDFLHHPIKDHGIDNYLVKGPTHDQDRFMYIHDYVKRNPSKEKCAETKSADVVQGRTAGIFEVVNYEDVALTLEKNMEQTIFSIVRKHGFTPLSVPKSIVDNVAIVAMVEGYILVRSWPEKRYCAVDIHLWGNFSKRNDLREALTAAFQSRTVSDYRIVVGGMYGSTTLASDEEDIGVRFSHNRNCDERELEEDALINQGTLEVLSEETLSMLEGDKVVAAVVCGFENKDNCVASKMLTKVDHLLTFWTCPELIHIEGDEDSVDVTSMFACERKILEELENSPPLDMILFDDSAPLSMTQIFDSILTVPSHRNQFLKKKHILASSFDGDRLWKLVSLAENYRQQSHTDLVSVAVYMLNGIDRNIGWVVAYAGDYSVLKLYELEQRVKGRLPALDIEVRSLLGGKKHAEKDLEFETWTFAPEKYDASPSLDQYNEQQPLGRQSVFQLQWTDPSASFYRCLELLEATLKKMDYKPTRFDTFKEVGDGGAVMSVYKEGSAVLVWDGRQQVVVNLFSFDQEKERADSFVKTLEELSGNTLQVALRDDQPRGIGRVISFSNDMKIDSKKDGSYHTEEL
jgi:S-adenosylmethionine/arginine decarboxylase-like enzyme